MFYPLLERKEKKHAPILPNQTFSDLVISDMLMVRINTKIYNFEAFTSIWLYGVKCTLGSIHTFSSVGLQDDPFRPENPLQHLGFENNYGLLSLSFDAIHIDVTRGLFPNTPRVLIFEDVFVFVLDVF